MRAACEAFFSVETSSGSSGISGTRNTVVSAATAYVFRDAWGERMLGRIPLPSIDPAQWAPEVAEGPAERPGFRVVALADVRRAIRRYLLNATCTLLVAHLESPLTVAGVKAVLPCPSWNTHGDCLGRRNGRCSRLHEVSTSAAQGRHLALLAEQCCAVTTLLGMKRASSTGAPDRLNDAVLCRVMPLRRRWFEKLARGLQPVSPRFESAVAVHECIAALPMETKYGLVDLVTEVWLKDLTSAADVGNFLKAMLLLAKLGPTLQTLPTKALQEKCKTLALGCTGKNANHYAMYKEPGTGAVRSVHCHCLRFWIHLEQGNAAAALMEGTAYLAFTDKSLRDINVAPSLNPGPVDLMELVEILSALCVMCYTSGHDVVLPRSYLLPYFCRQGLCFQAYPYAAFTASMDCLPELQRHIYSLLQGMVQGRIFAAMGQEEQKRQSSFDDWRDLCVRASMALIFLAAHCKESAHTQLRATWDKIQSLASLDVNRVTMGDFRFPRDDREGFLGRSAIDLLDRVGAWYAKSVDGLLAVVRPEFGPSSAGGWRPAEAELVVFVPKETPPAVLFFRAEPWMSAAVRPWIQAGAAEWLSKQERRIAGENSVLVAAPEDAESRAEELKGLEELNADLKRKEQVILSPAGANTEAVLLCLLTIWLSWPLDPCVLGKAFVCTQAAPLRCTAA